jgi:hypothetical protein
MLKTKMFSMIFVLLNKKVEKKLFFREEKFFFLKMQARENIVACFDRDKRLSDRDKSAR